MRSTDRFQDRLHTALERSRYDSQKALADELGVREATASGWFNGSWPREAQMRALVDVLGVSGHWLLTGEGPMAPDPQTDPVKLEVIGMVVDEEVDALALRQFAEDVRGLERDDAAAQEALEARLRAADPKDPGPGTNDGPSGHARPKDPPTDDENDPPGTNRHAGP